MKRNGVTFLLIVFIIFFNTISNAGIVNWSVFEGGNGHYYEAVLADDPIDWYSAKSAAELRGGYLATITSEAENNFLFSLISDNPEFWSPGWNLNGQGPWLGGFQPDGSPEPSGNWQWITGELFLFTKWAPFEPNNHLFNDLYPENHLQFHGQDKLIDSTWNDLYAYDNLYPPVSYIVEYNQIPEPSTLLLLGLGWLVLMRKQRIHK